MLKTARKEAPKAKFTQGSFLNVKLPSFDAVTSLGECFNYLFDNKNTKKQLTLLFCRVYDALYSGGVFIFDIIEPGKNPATKYLEGQDWAILLQATENVKRNTLTPQMTIFRRVGKLYRNRCKT